MSRKAHIANCERLQKALKHKHMVGRVVWWLQQRSLHFHPRLRDQHLWQTIPTCLNLSVLFTGKIDGLRLMFFTKVSGMLAGVIFGEALSVLKYQEFSILFSSIYAKLKEEKKKRKRRSKNASPRIQASWQTSRYKSRNKIQPIRQLHSRQFNQLAREENNTPPIPRVSHSLLPEPEMLCPSWPVPRAITIALLHIKVQD